MTVWIEDIVEAFEDADANWKSYLDTETGEIIFVPLSENELENFTEEEKQLFSTIDEIKKYLLLPSQKELREYDIMEEYAKDCSNYGYQQRLFHALNNSKPFRNFRSQIRYLDLEEDYNQYRYLIFSSMARSWCIQHEIEYSVDSEEVKEYLAQVEAEEKLDQNLDEFEDSLDEFEYKEELDDYFEE